MTTTATTLMLQRVDGVRAAINDLLDASLLTQMERDWGDTVWMGPTGTWGKLDTDARRLQSRVLEDYGSLFETISVLLREQPPDAIDKAEKSDQTIREILEQDKLTWINTVDDARTRAMGALEILVDLLDRLHDASEGSEVYVPDTNALLHNLELDQWQFAGVKTFELVLGPSILVELDELKINHRNTDVREKAEGLITRIKGYRSRGKLTEGVPLRKSVSTLRAIGIEPRMSESLSWLDPKNRDDRFIATVIEIIRQRPRSAVTIVTRDVNLQSKAELASLPFVEPPDP